MSFRTARERAGITQAQVARKFGIAKSSVNDWEKGRCFPKPSRLIEVAEYLGCEVAEILKEGD